MKLLIFLFFITVGSLFAKTLFYEGFSDIKPSKKGSNPLKEKIFPSPIDSLVEGLVYTRSRDLFIQI